MTFSLINASEACAIARSAIEVIPMGTMPVALPAELVAALIRAAEDAETTKQLVCNITGNNAATWPDHGSAPMAIAATISIMSRDVKRLRAERDGQVTNQHEINSLIKERDLLHAKLDAFDNWMATDEFRSGKDGAERGLCLFKAKAMEHHLYCLNARIEQVAA
jgi:hypothetical protein